MITDTAASVGAKPNSRKPRIFTVIGISPGRARNSDRLTSVNEWTKANTAPATMPLLISGNTTCQQRAPARGAEARGGELEVRRQRVQADRDGAHRERQADHHVADEQRR